MPPARKGTKKDITRPRRKYKKRKLDEASSNGKYDLKINRTPRAKHLNKGTEDLSLH